MLHHELTVWMRAQAGQPATPMIFAGHAPPERGNPYVVVDSAILTDNGETHAGQLRTKLYTQIIDFFSTDTLAGLEPHVRLVKGYLGTRQFQIGVPGTGYWIQSAILKNEIPADMIRDPEGRAEGLSQVRLIYNIAARPI